MIYFLRAKIVTFLHFRNYSCRNMIIRDIWKAFGDEWKGLPFVIMLGNYPETLAGIPLSCRHEIFILSLQRCSEKKKKNIKQLSQMLVFIRSMYVTTNYSIHYNIIYL